MEFFELVQHEAGLQGRVFFLDCGEGNDEIVGDMDCSDLSGWLIDSADAEKFEAFWSRDDCWDLLGEEWNDAVAFVRWSVAGGKVSVRFDNVYL